MGSRTADNRGDFAQAAKREPQRPGYATVDAVLAAAMVVLLLQLANAPSVGAMAAAGLVFLAIWGALYLLQWRILRRLLDQEPRFPTPVDDSSG